MNFILENIRIPYNIIPVQVPSTCNAYEIQTIPTLYTWISKSQLDHPHRIAKGGASASGLEQMSNVFTLDDLYVVIGDLCTDKHTHITLNNNRHKRCKATIERYSLPVTINLLKVY